MYKFSLRMGRKDLDLIALFEDKGFKGEVCNAIRAFAAGRKFVFSMPESLPKTNKTKARADIVLSDDDKDVADFLRSIKDGNGNSVVLSIIRASLPFPVVSPYLDDDSVYYDVFAKKKRRGRKKGSIAQPTAERRYTRDASDKTVSDKEPVETVRPAPVPVAAAMSDVAEVKPSVPSEPSVKPSVPAAAPARPSLIGAVEERQREAKESAPEDMEEAVTVDAPAEPEESDFDPFAMGMDMMKQF